MAIISAATSFEHLAETVTTRVAELLCAAVSIVDGRGKVISSTDGSAIGLSSLSGISGAELRVPVRLDGQGGEIIVGEPLNGEVISPRLAQVLIELVVNQTMVARTGSPTGAHELKNTFISDLLHGLVNDEEKIIRDAKLLGLDFAPPRAVILIDAAEYILDTAADREHEASDAQIRRRAQVVIGSIVNFFHLPSDTICAYIGDGEVAVLKASNTQNLVSWADSPESGGLSSPSWANLTALRRAGNALVARLRSDTNASMTVGIGRYHPGVCGLARSYQDARAALSLGRRFHGQNGVHCLDSLGIAAFVGVSDERTKIDLATYLLSPLDHEPELLETLNVFFAADCSPSHTAARVSIHRNTLSYRFDKITSLTGLDPRRFDEAVQIRLALLLRSLRGSPS